jgi:hypothetical protein
MSLTVTTDKLHDGVMNTTVQLTGFSDEMGDPEPVVAVDASELSPAARRVKVQKLSWSVDGGAVKLAWATATEPIPFANLTGQGEMDYCQIGGAACRSDEATGDILLSTDDFGDGSNFTVKIEMRKKF